jgi:hypothetical protein
MRTFAGHASKHELHGITVVVETDGSEIFVGRCDDIDAEGVHLKDADRHDAAASAPSRAEFLERAQRFGVWPNHRRITVPASRVRSVTRLFDAEVRA